MNLNASGCCQNQSMHEVTNGIYRNAMAEGSKKEGCSISSFNSSNPPSHSKHCCNKNCMPEIETPVQGHRNESASSEKGNILEKLLDCIKLLLSAIMTMFEQNNEADGASEQSATAPGTSIPQCCCNGMDHSTSNSKEGAENQNGHVLKLEQLVEIIMQMLQMLVGTSKGETAGKNNAQDIHGDGSKTEMA